MIKSDDRFEIPAARHLGMVVFRLKGPNELTEALLKKINTSGKLHCVPAALKVSRSFAALWRGVFNVRLLGVFFKNRAITSSVSL